jgi:thiol-disulfide isomerase/thioredoxin
MIRFLVLLFLLAFACESCTTVRPILPNSSVHWSTCGYEIGDHACNISLRDQNGNIWNLYDFYGSVIVLDFSAGWCGACKRAARNIQRTQNEKQEIINFFYVSIMLEDSSSSSPPSQRFLNEWALEYEITSAPVLSAGRDLAAEDMWSVSSLPTFYILNRDLVIIDIIVGYNEEILDSSINRSIESI